ncbi:MAG TPA: thiol reductant ABC exporter subunit CydD [Caulobacteraceae bacterium]
MAPSVADPVLAIGFAIGLSQAVSRLGDGWQGLTPWLGLMAASAVARGFAAQAAVRAGADLACGIKSEVRRRLVEATIAARPAERPPVGVALARVVEGVEALDGYFARFAPARRMAAIGPAIILAAMATASPVAAMIGAAAFVPLIAALTLAGGAAAREARRQFEALSRLSGQFADRIRALPAILAFEAEGRVTADLARGSSELADRSLRVLRIAFLSTAALEFFAALSVALIAVYCGFNLLRLPPLAAPEHLDLPRAVFVLALAPELYAPFRRLAAAYHDRQTAEAVSGELEGAVRTSPSPTEAAGSMDRRAPALRFNNVRVVHAGAGRAALDRFNLDVCAGETVALVGPSGSGKTTALNLLLGLIGPSVGEITVDGQPIDPERGVAARAAWAGQSPVVVPGTLFDNLALARRKATPAEVEFAAARAGLDQAPDGLSREIDERGGGLSGGERRRLALARAFLRDAPLLLLDEPTAHLDARSEQELLPVIARAVKGRTALIATHSDAVAALADRVVRLAI